MRLVPLRESWLLCPFSALEKVGTGTLDSQHWFYCLFAFKNDNELELAAGVGWHIKAQALVPSVKCSKESLCKHFHTFLIPMNNAAETYSSIV